MVSTATAGKVAPSRRVSVVVVNYKGADDTNTCIDGIKALEWPTDQLEIVVVENNSGDGSAARIRAAHPDVVLLELDENTGFAGGCNRGVSVATGEYIAFLNNDARPDPRWLAAAVDELAANPDVGCVASKVLTWDGDAVDFVDAALSFYGHGFKLHVGAPNDSSFDVAHDVLFASGAAMVLPKQVFESAGGFDERYFMFFEDVDLGWRLWMLGHRVRYVPQSLVYHRHHASMSQFANWREHYLLERNALFTIFKNYDETNMPRMLAAAQALAVRRGVASGTVDAHALDLQRGVRGEGEDSLTLPKQAVAPMFAIDALVEWMPSLAATRAQLQKARVRPDSELLRMFRLPLHPNIAEPSFVEGFTGIVDALEIAKRFAPRRRILVVTGDNLTPRMAGPAIRAWQISLALSREHDVQLVSTVGCELRHADFATGTVDPARMVELEAWCDIVVFQGYIMHEYPVIAASKKIIVVDIYDPFHLEQLEQARDLGEEERRETVLASTLVLNQQLSRGDYFLCASDKQRDFWLGQMAAVGRINPVTYDDSPSLSALIDLAPFGVTDEPPVHQRPAIKGVTPGIGPDDEVILWGGGIYNWFDPLTLIRAVDKLRVRRPNVRLFFLGVQHPNPNVPEMRMVTQARRLAADLGIVDTHVFFNEQWVAYDDRQNYLLEADVGVSTHFDHVETAFSFRTRILDYLWASLPIVTTGGDSFADLIAATPVGLTVPAEDVDALEAALFRILDDRELRTACQANAVAIAEDLRWSRVLQPFVEFCRNPRRAPDLIASVALPGVEKPRPTWKERGGVVQDLRIVRSLISQGGIQLTMRKAMGRVRRALK
jgi:GT2 family glycosyltransferase/glycosyltransferase involved in cell wall biosynthesis